MSDDNVALPTFAAAKHVAAQLLLAVGQVQSIPSRDSNRFVMQIDSNRFVL